MATLANGNVMDNELPRAGFSHVDQEADKDFYVGCLEYQNADPFTLRYKRRTFELLNLASGDRVLDIGCGLGADVRSMAKIVAPTGRVIGLDASETMIAEACRRNVDSDLRTTFHRGDAHALPYRDASFDCCRADRTFQHLPDPARALTEMIRVLKPGGRLLAVDPDHDSLVIDTPYPEVARRYLAFRADTFAAGDIAHRLYAMLTNLGMNDVAVEGTVNVSTNYERARTFRYVEGIRVAQKHGVVTEEEADRWIAYLEEVGRTGRFLASNTYLITTARKPD